MNPTFDDGGTTFATIPDASNFQPPEPELNAEDDFIFVQMPDGSVRAVRKDQLHVNAPTDKQDSPAKLSEPVAEAQFYVWLANGDVKRVNESDLPQTGGSNATMGHWQIGNKIHTVVAVYPVEETV